jgi:hypothetical protein
VRLAGDGVRADAHRHLLRRPMQSLQRVRVARGRDHGQDLVTARFVDVDPGPFLRLAGLGPGAEAKRLGSIQQLGHPDVAGQNLDVADAVAGEEDHVDRMRLRRQPRHPGRSGARVAGARPSEQPASHVASGCLRARVRAAARSYQRPGGKASISAT